MQNNLLNKATLTLLLALPAHAISATYTVDTVNKLKNRLETAKDGDVIKVDGNGGKAGVYTYNGTTYSIYTTDGHTNVAAMFLLNNAKNVTIEALNPNKKPVLRGKDYTDKYAFYAQKADGLTIRNIRFSHARKGVVIDRTSDLTFEKNTISEVGEEAFHLRDGSDNALIRSNHIHDTGLVKVERGEAIYICNDRKMWNSYYQPAELEENYLQNCDFAHITGNTLGPNIGNNSVDVKEGTVGVYINNNTINLGWTRAELKNSNATDHPDVSIHLKGTEAVVTNNTFNFKGAPASLFRVISVDQQLDKDPALKATHGYNNWAVNNTIKNANNGQYAFHASSRGGAYVGCNMGALDKLAKPKSGRDYIKVTGSNCEAPKPPTTKSVKPTAPTAAPTTNTQTSTANNSGASAQASASTRNGSVKVETRAVRIKRDPKPTTSNEPTFDSAQNAPEKNETTFEPALEPTQNTSGKSQSTQPADSACVKYQPGSKLTEITLNNAKCISVSGGLSGKKINFADSDKNTSCDFRAHATAKNSEGSHVIDSNWETVSKNWTGNTITFSQTNDCQYLKLRVNG